MAFTLGDAIVRIAGEDSDLAKKLKNNEGAVKGFAKRSGDAIRGAFGTAMKVGAAAVITGVVGIGVAALSTENQFRDSTKKIQAALGVTEADAVGVGQSMRDVWANNFGDSVADVEQGIIATSQAMERLGGISNEQLTATTEDAFRLRDAYDTEVSESVGAAATLMDEFGLTGDQAMDFITTGMQKGLNTNGDFLDSIGEYSNLFKASGFDADEMFSIIETGTKGGVLGTDKIADSIKEMGIILNEGGADTAKTFSDMGMNFAGMQANVKNGKATWADYFPVILEGLQGIEDPIARSAAETALFGTMAEDLGVGFTDSLSTISTGLEDMSGATDTLDAQYQTWPSMFEGMKRSGLDALTPLSSELLTMANDAMPQIKEWFAGFVVQLQAAMPDIIEFVRQFVVFAGEWGPTILAVLAGAVTAFTALGVIATVAGWVSSLVAGWAALTAAWAIAWPIIAGIGALLSGPVLLAIGAVVAVIGLLAVAWNNNWGGIQEKTATAVEFIQTAINTFLTKIQTWWAENKEGIITTVAELWATVKAKFTQFIETARGLMTAFKEGMNGDWTAMKEQLTTIAINMITSIVTTIGTLWAKVQPKVSEAITGMKGKFTNVDWASIGKAIVDGIGRGIEAAKDALMSKMKGIAKGALDAAKGMLGINSPSKVMADEVGSPIVEGVEGPLVSGRKRIASAMARMVAVPSGLAQAGGGFGSGSNTTNNRTANIGPTVINVTEAGDAKLTARLVENERRARHEGLLGF